MIKVDLITGFLGAGKTTFLQHYAKHLMKKGLHLGIIVNDFGAINVDRLLLQELEGENCDIEQIVGGNVVSDWKRRFKAKLIALSMTGVDRVIVEPSGIYDVDTFFDVLYDEPMDSWYEVGSIFTIVDAKMDTRLSGQAEYLLLSQLAHCGQVILSKTENVMQDQISEAVEKLTALLEKYDCRRDLSQCILAKSLRQLTEADYEKLMNCGWFRAGYQTAHFHEEEAFTSQFFLNLKIPQEEIRERVEGLFSDETLGQIFRVKGFFEIEEGKWQEVNATQDQYETRQMKKGQQVLIVIGCALDEKAIGEHLTGAVRGIEEGFSGTGACR